MIKVTGGILLFLPLFFSCKKDPLTRTYQMAGNHTWRRIISDTDTSFTLIFDREIVVLNSSTIVFPSATPQYMDTLKYASNKGNTLIFTSQYIAPSYLSTEYDTIYYDYARNTIEFVEYAISKGNSGFVRLYTP